MWTCGVRAEAAPWIDLQGCCFLDDHYIRRCAQRLFVMMLEDSVLPNNVTILSVIQACSLMGTSELFSHVHALVVLLELEDGFVEEAMRLLECLYLRRGDVCSSEDVIAALLYGCSISGSLKNGEGIHGHLIKMGAFPSISVENSLMGMYARFEQVDEAHLVFNGMKVKVVGYCLTSVLSIVQACSNAGLLQQGRMLHGYIMKSGFLFDVSICNALISMYAKLGRTEFAKMIFSADGY
jgi:pentatricopeptide repeat protein